jgi:pheromone shutdown-related protein TraB
MNSIETISPNVDLILLGQKKIYLVGTAHVSAASADLAEQVINDMNPDSVAVELCESRYKSLKEPTRWKNMDIFEVIKNGRQYVLMAQLFLAGFQKRLGNELKIAPGAEMMRAINVAENKGSTVVLADRDVKTTLRRTWSALGLWSMLKIFFAIISGMFNSNKISEEDIEKLKSADALELMMEEFSAALPEVRTCLIDERDRYLAKKIADAPGSSVVAVVGAGHVAGIKSWLGQDIELKELESIPPGNPLFQVIGWSIPALVLLLFILGFVSSGAERSVEMAGAWILINSVAGGLGALAALAHPVTILTAVAVSPFTSLYPFIAGGWVAGLVEAIFRKPRVSDLESLGSDIASLRGMWSNRVLRILLVIALTNLFGSVGTFLALGWLASLV